MALTQHESVTHATGTPGTADTVDVILGMNRHVEIENMADIGNIKPPRRYVGGDQELDFTATKSVQRACAHRLIQIAVNGSGIIVVIFQRLGDNINVNLAVAEDNAIGNLIAFAFDQRPQNVALFLGGTIFARRFENAHGLNDGFRGGRLTRHFHPLGIVQKLLRNPGNLGRHRGREKQGLPGEWRQLEDALDIGDEAHIQHAVGLVDDHDLNAGQHQFAALKMIQQAARCGDQNVNAPVDQAVLILEADAADQQRHR